MSRYDTYFLMKAEDASGYVQEKISYFSPDAELECKEIGDGNLNYVFRVKDTKSGNTIIVKQAGEFTRISADMKLSTDRGRIEAKILGIQGEYAPGLVPKVYLYDEVMCAMIMQDMTGHSMMRTALMKHEKFPRFADDISTFMVNSLLLTTDVVMDHKKKKEYVKSFINPDLCEITEDLVYTEPYNDCKGRNNVFPPNAEFVKKMLYEDTELHLEVAKLKFDFLNNAQSLIHGDLHSGSIFINKDHTFVFDPEFAFYGPMGYDVGNIIANMLFVWMNADATIEDAAQQEDYKTWVEITVKDIVDMFIEKFKEAYRIHAQGIMAKTPGFLEWYLGTVLADTAGVCGLEMNRRMVGMANVKDITTIADENKRARAERIIITMAKDCIKNRTQFLCGQRYIKALKNAVAEIDSLK
ncbi:S-methyl-5-thioribose kinase [Oscillospiraceae bacterium PP1C4]